MREPWCEPCPEKSHSISIIPSQQGRLKLVIYLKLLFRLGYGHCIHITSHVITYIKKFIPFDERIYPDPMFPKNPGMAMQQSEIPSM